jgi:molybdopterin converting factor small subunit
MNFLKIDVRLFGIMRDRIPNAHSGNLTVEMTKGKSVADLRTQLDLADLVGLAVNENVAEDNSLVLKDGDQVHLYTAIGGG